MRPRGVQGREFSKISAADGWNLVLVARDRERLTQLANEQAALHGTTARVIAKDLSAPNAAPEIFDELQKDNIPISILINNRRVWPSGAVYPD